MEAFVIVLVPLVAAAIYLGARFSSHGAQRSPQEELKQLHDQRAWHADRLQRAREKKWDRDMIDQIASQLAEAEYQVARVSAAQAGAPRRG